MIAKDWILLLIPILFNGIIVFILQKISDKKQIIRAIKMDYASVLRQKIDISLSLHARTTRLVNEGNPSNDSLIRETTQQYVDSVLDVYYYYIQNQLTFKSFDSQIQKIASQIMQLMECSHHTPTNLELYSALFNKIKDDLLILKNNCIKLNF
ncbi:MAG: hypothetical protein IJZ44_01910 [Lachnospiraceae bacterium]|nr:hypothetical protein [Lachnospiraceae bacterium]